MKEMVQKHNDIVKRIEKLENELRSMEDGIKSGFENLSREEAIKHYDQLSDSTIKFDLFINLKKKYGTKN